MSQILNTIQQKIADGQKLLAFLLDPDFYGEEELPRTIKLLQQTPPDLILVGGSIIASNIHDTIQRLKEHTSIPVVLFPGNVIQLSEKADGILFLSLISGRNPDLLIGSHVAAAPMIKNYHLETLSTGYILVDGGTRTSVEYISQTAPIPAQKTNIAVATALAGEMLGLQLIYLEAGSGASTPVPVEMVKSVKKAIKTPLIVGGGLNTSKKIRSACEAGADIIVIGNALEKEPSLLKEFYHTIKG